MNYSDKKFVAHIKDSPYFLYIYRSEFTPHGDEPTLFSYKIPDEDLGNISMYAARNIIEEDILLAASNGLVVPLVEILEVEINYTIKLNKESLDSEQEIS